eukprot:CAMPEP_0172760532 /NCGR_PEP_ID=MMETSP1074-20121228/169783_1 /TAXON_ID=2916 /ORGANISM="Ceratium fusus, Strain PA161109" /LENGTH=86 /DNA_ID=CAMNT_0013594539 /DNA_START=15 /DNA_END=276 /DNA_ORIENTATION=-
MTLLWHSVAGGNRSLAAKGSRSDVAVAVVEAATHTDAKRHAFHWTCQACKHSMDQVRIEATAAILPCHLHFINEKQASCMAPATDK